MANRARPSELLTKGICSTGETMVADFAFMVYFNLCCSALEISGRMMVYNTAISSFLRHDGTILLHVEGQLVVAHGVCLCCVHVCVFYACVRVCMCVTGDRY